MSDLRTIPISSVRENKVALRTVNMESEEFLGLVDSMRIRGFMGAITVRERLDESGNVYFELVDGLHRYSAAKQAGLTEIGVDVRDLTDDQVLEAQIMANIHRVETKPIEYTGQLKRILTRNPNMTELELANKLGKSIQWIQDRLSLNKIDNEKIKNLIDEGKIVLSNAYALAKLPAEEMLDFLDRAMTETPEEFVPRVHKRAKEIKEANRRGANAAPLEFEPSAHLQKMKAVKEELETKKVISTLIQKYQITDPLEAALITLKWILHLDPDSVEEQKRKDEQRKAEREAAKAKRLAAQRQAKEASENTEAAHAVAEAAIV